MSEPRSSASPVRRGPDGINCDPDSLVRMVRAGDEDALEAMTRCYGDRLLAVGRRYCGEAEAAKDAVQDTMLAAGRHLGDFRGDGSLEGWLVRMVANFCHRMHRGRKNDPKLHAPLDDAIPDPRHASPEERVARGEILAHLGRALGELSPEDRVLVLLSDAEDWKAPEIAERVGMTPAAVRQRLSRARKRLRESLGPLRDYLEA